MLKVYFMVALMTITEVIEAVKVDKSAIAYASYINQKWMVVQDIKDWESNDTIVAMAKFDNDQQKTGWMYLEVKTKESAPDDVQSYAAGLIEGFLTRTYIVESYKEFYSNDVCKTNPQKCDWIIGRFKENKRYIEDQIIEKSVDDPYWHHVNLLYHQMDGITEGCRLKTLIEGLDITEMDFDMGVVLLNFLADFSDMDKQYDLVYPPKNRKKRSSSGPSCSVIIKYLKDDHDILMAHNTWHEYRAMGYRFLKNYNLNLHLLPGSRELIPGHTISMSSYAGNIFSLDDFYLTSAGLGATETTLFVYEMDLFGLLKPNGTVYEPLRVVVSNRLSSNGTQWQDTFGKHNSGTYNNQWMVVDFNVLNRSAPGTLEEGVLVVSEQLPEQFHVEDQTKVLRETGYWASYNRAYYPEIHRRAGGLKKEQEFGEWFSHGKTARAKIFRRDHHKIKGIDSLMELMRYNDYENDEFAVIEGCDPKRHPAGSIANRADLYNGSCTFDEYDMMVVRSGYGALDAKIASSKSFPSLEFRAVAGPTYERHPPFKWSTTSLETKPKFRPIDEFKFKPITHKWEINGKSSGSNNIVPFSSTLLVVVLLINTAVHQLTAS